MKNILSLLDIKLCPLCDKKTSKAEFCNTCFNILKSLFINYNICKFCGKQIKIFDICGLCQKNKYYYNSMWYSLNYTFPIDKLIINWKFKNKIFLSNCLGSLMISNPPNWINKINFDIIIPIPLSEKKFLSRSFNQSYELALIISKKYKIPIIKKYYFSKKNIISQHTLKRKKRFENINNSFQLNKNLNYKNILIIDDIITTGSTINEFSKLLQKDKQLKNIYVWILAHKNIN